MEKYSKCYVWGAWQTSEGVIYITVTGWGARQWNSGGVSDGEVLWEKTGSKVKEKLKYLE